MCTLGQDDSALNCKMLAKLIESETAGPFAQATVITADDGATAVEALRTEMDAGREVHFILIDYIMVTPMFMYVLILSFSLRSRQFLAQDRSTMYVLMVLCRTTGTLLLLLLLLHVHTSLHHL